MSLLFRSLRLGSTGSLLRSEGTRDFPKSSGDVSDSFTSSPSWDSLNFLEKCDSASDLQP